MPNPEKAPKSLVGFDGPPARSPWWWLLVVAALGTTLCLCYSQEFKRVLGYYVQPLALDAFAVLAALDGNRLGLDLSEGNPLDLLDRPHVYSSWWLYLQYLGLGRSHLLGFYITSLCAFLLPALAFFRPRSFSGFVWLFSCIASMPVLFAFHRGNNDLLIFGVLSLVVPCLLSRKPLVRLAAPVLIMLATGLKYYPLIGLCLLFVVESPRERLLLLAFSGLQFLVIMAGFLRDHGFSTSIVPDAQGFLGVGASLLFSGEGLPGPLNKVAGVLMGLLVVGLAWRMRGARGWTLSVVSDARYHWFILGASLFAGCYWLMPSWGYRMVFLLWLVPFLHNPPGLGRMPPLLRVSTLWMRWWVLALFWSHLLVRGGSVVFRISAHEPYWLVGIVVIQFGYLVLAIYCTLLVADLVFERLRRWRDDGSLPMPVSSP